MFVEFMTRINALTFQRFLGEELEVATVINEETSLAFYSDSKISQTDNVVALAPSPVLPVVTIFAAQCAHDGSQDWSDNVQDRGNIRCNCNVSHSMSYRCSTKQTDGYLRFAAIEVVFIGSAVGTSGP